MSCHWQFHLFCSSPSSSCSSFTHNTVPFPFPFPLTKSVKATSFNFPHSLSSIHSSSRSNISVASPTLTRETRNPSAESTRDQSQEVNEGNLSRSYVWVNPNSPRALKLKQQSYDARYSFLVGLAESLNSCGSTEGEVLGILGGLGDKIVEQDAVVLLNNMSNAENALLVLRFFQQRMNIKKEVILYNVTMKVFRKCKDLDKSEKLFCDMLKRGVRPDNVTFSTIISCARLCSLPNNAVVWFEKMPNFECSPDDVTYSAMIDVYGRAGNVDMALGLYDRARMEKWRLDVVTFSTLIKIYGQARNFDGCLNVYEEMKALGVKPNLVLFNTLLDAMGRAKRPWQAKILHRELINSGFSPNWATYAALLRAYGKARYGEDALVVYREMKERGMELNVVLFNTLLAMCADLGFEEEAIEFFEEMKNSRKCEPDSWTFSSMITVYSCHGKVQEAEATLNEMIEAGFEPNIYVLTSLIQCYGKAQRADDVVSTFNRLIELGISPDERFCGCLLNAMTHIPKKDLEKLIFCIEEANPMLGSVVRQLMKDGNGESKFKEEALEILKSAGPDVKKAYCNCLMDLCVNIDLLERACELLDLGLKLEIYTDLQSRSETQWSLHVRSLSLGAALTALHVWINDLKKALEAGEELPPLLGINTGHGKHRYSDRGLATVFESHLKELKAPFHEAPDKVGWFLTTKAAATSWLESRSSLE